MSKIELFEKDFGLQFSKEIALNSEITDEMFQQMESMKEEIHQRMCAESFYSFFEEAYQLQKYLNNQYTILQQMLLDLDKLKETNKQFQIWRTCMTQRDAFEISLDYEKQYNLIMEQAILLSKETQQTNIEIETKIQFNFFYEQININQSKINFKEKYRDEQYFNNIQQIINDTNQFIKNFSIKCTTKQWREFQELVNQKKFTKFRFNLKYINPKIQDIYSNVFRQFSTFTWKHKKLIYSKYTSKLKLRDLNKLIDEKLLNDNQLKQLLETIEQAILRKYQELSDIKTQFISREKIEQEIEAIEESILQFELNKKSHGLTEHELIEYQEQQELLKSKQALWEEIKDNPDYDKKPKIENIQNEIARIKKDRKQRITEIQLKYGLINQIQHDKQKTQAETEYISQLERKPKQFFQQIQTGQIQQEDKRLQFIPKPTQIPLKQKREAKIVLKKKIQTNVLENQTDNLQINELNKFKEMIEEQQINSANIEDYNEIQLDKQQTLTTQLLNQRPYNEQMWDLLEKEEEAQKAIAIYDTPKNQNDLQKITNLKNNFSKLDDVFLNQFELKDYLKKNLKSIIINTDIDNMRSTLKHFIKQIDCDTFEINAEQLQRQYKSQKFFGNYWIRLKRMERIYFNRNSEIISQCISKEKSMNEIEQNIIQKKVSNEFQLKYNQYKKAFWILYCKFLINTSKQLVNAQQKCADINYLRLLSEEQLLKDIEKQQNQYFIRYAENIKDNKQMLILLNIIIQKLTDQFQSSVQYTNTYKKFTEENYTKFQEIFLLELQQLERKDETLTNIVQTLRSRIDKYQNKEIKNLNIQQEYKKIKQGWKLFYQIFKPLNCEIYKQLNNIESELNLINTANQKEDLQIRKQKRIKLEPISEFQKKIDLEEQLEMEKTLQQNAKELNIQYQNQIDEEVINLLEEKEQARQEKDNPRQNKSNIVIKKPSNIAQTTDDITESQIIEIEEKKDQNEKFKKELFYNAMRIKIVIRTINEKLAYRLCPMNLFTEELELLLKQYCITKDLEEHLKKYNIINIWEKDINYLLIEFKQKEIIDIDQRFILMLLKKNKNEQITDQNKLFRKLMDCNILNQFQLSKLIIKINLVNILAFSVYRNIISLNDYKEQLKVFYEKENFVNIIDYIKSLDEYLNKIITTLIHINRRMTILINGFIHKTLDNRKLGFFQTEAIKQQLLFKMSMNPNLYQKLSANQISKQIQDIEEDIKIIVEKQNLLKRIEKSQNFSEILEKITDEKDLIQILRSKTPILNENEKKAYTSLLKQINKSTIDRILRTYNLQENQSIEIQRLNLQSIGKNLIGYKEDNELYQTSSEYQTYCLEYPYPNIGDKQRLEAYGEYVELTQDNINYYLHMIWRFQQFCFLYENRLEEIKKPKRFFTKEDQSYETVEQLILDFQNYCFEYRKWKETFLNWLQIMFDKYQGIQEIFIENKLLNRKITMEIILGAKEFDLQPNKIFIPFWRKGSTDNSFSIFEGTGCKRNEVIDVFVNNWEEATELQGRYNPRDGIVQKEILFKNETFFPKRFSQIINDFQQMETEEELKITPLSDFLKLEKYENLTTDQISELNEDSQRVALFIYNKMKDPDSNIKTNKCDEIIDCLRASLRTTKYMCKQHAQDSRDFKLSVVQQTSDLEMHNAQQKRRIKPKEGEQQIGDQYHYLTTKDAIEYINMNLKDQMQTYIGRRIVQIKDKLMQCDEELDPNLKKIIENNQIYRYEYSQILQTIDYTKAKLEITTDELKKYRLEQKLKFFQSEILKYRPQPLLLELENKNLEDNKIILTQQQLFNNIWSQKTQAKAFSNLRPELDNVINQLNVLLYKSMYLWINPSLEKKAIQSSIVLKTIYDNLEFDEKQSYLINNRQQKQVLNLLTLLDENWENWQKDFHGKEQERYILEDKDYIGNEDHSPNDIYEIWDDTFKYNYGVWKHLQDVNEKIFGDQKEVYEDYILDRLRQLIDYEDFEQIIQGDKKDLYERINNEFIKIFFENNEIIQDKKVLADKLLYDEYQQFFQFNYPFNDDIIRSFMEQLFLENPKKLKYILKNIKTDPKLGKEQRERIFEIGQQIFNEWDLKKLYEYKKKENEKWDAKVDKYIGGSIKQKDNLQTEDNIQIIDSIYDQYLEQKYLLNVLELTKWLREESGFEELNTQTTIEFYDRDCEFIDYVINNEFITSIQKSFQKEEKIILKPQQKKNLYYQFVEMILRTGLKLINNIVWPNQQHKLRTLNEFIQDCMDLKLYNQELGYGIISEPTKFTQALIENLSFSCDYGNEIFLIDDRNKFMSEIMQSRFVVTNDGENYLEEPIFFQQIFKVLREVKMTQYFYEEFKELLKNRDAIKLGQIQKLYRWIANHELILNNLRLLFDWGLHIQYKDQIDKNQKAYYRSKMKNEINWFQDFLNDLFIDKNFSFNLTVNDIGNEIILKQLPKELENYLKVNEIIKDKNTMQKILEEQKRYLHKELIEQQSINKLWEELWETDDMKEKQQIELQIGHRKYEKFYKALNRIKRKYNDEQIQKFKERQPLTGNDQYKFDEIINKKLYAHNLYQKFYLGQNRKQQQIKDKMKLNLTWQDIMIIKGIIKDRQLKNGFEDFLKTNYVNPKQENTKFITELSKFQHKQTLMKGEKDFITDEIIKEPIVKKTDVIKSFVRLHTEKIIDDNKIQEQAEQQKNELLCYLETLEFLKENYDIDKEVEEMIDNVLLEWITQFNEY